MDVSPVLDLLEGRVRFITAGTAHVNLSGDTIKVKGDLYACPNCALIRKHAACCFILHPNNTNRNGNRPKIPDAELEV